MSPPEDTGYKSPFSDSDEDKSSDRHNKKEVKSKKQSKKNEFIATLLRKGLSTMQLRKNLMPDNYYDFNPLAHKRNKNRYNSNQQEFRQNYVKNHID